MNDRVVACFIAAFMIAQSSAAGAALPGSAPLRTLEFKTVADIATTVRIVPHAFNETGAPLLGNEVRTHVDGTIDVSVIKAFEDGSLAVDVSERAKNREGQVVPLGIFPDGYLLATGESSKSLTDEESPLVALLGPNVVVGHDLSAGNSWTINHDDGATHLQLREHIDAVASEDSVQISLDGALTSGSARNFAQTMRGSMHYNPTMTVPRGAVLDVEKRQDSADASTKTLVHVSYELVRDSLAPKGL
ncbi:MAG: hypothetical protein NVS1B14_10560 [Vulcanimicrobiaceae bacterium]